MSASLLSGNNPAARLPHRLELCVLPRAVKTSDSTTALAVVVRGRHTWTTLSLQADAFRHQVSAVSASSLGYTCMSTVLTYRELIEKLSGCSNHQMNNRPRLPNVPRIRGTLFDIHTDNRTTQ
jgi:hypothetical protein